MWVAVTMAALGFLSIAVITQFYGYRLGGTITVPILSVYTFINVLMLPVFLVSTLVAYLGLAILKRRTLIYGRDELIAAILIGTLGPVIILFTLTETTGFEARTVVFIGSILPGLAAYNLHQLKPIHRRGDLLSTVGLFAGLCALGWLLVTPGIARTLGTITPPVLFGPTADVAAFKGATVATSPEPAVVPRLIAVSVLTLGLAGAEVVRSRFDVRVGVITAALLALFALLNVWFLVLYAVLYIVTLGVIELLNRLTLRYGRVLLGVGTAFTTLLAVPLTLVLPIDRGLTAFFTAILAGVTAYNAHATAPRESRLVLPLQVVAFVPSLIVARAVVEPAARGIPQALGPVVLLGSVVVIVAALLYARHVSIQQPSNESVLSSSVLTGGEGT